MLRNWFKEISWININDLECTTSQNYYNSEFKSCKGRNISDEIFTFK